MSSWVLGVPATDFWCVGIIRSINGYPVQRRANGYLIITVNRFAHSLAHVKEIIKELQGSN